MPTPITVAVALQQGQQQLYASNSPAVDAELLMMQVLRCERAVLYAWPERCLEVDVHAAYMALLQRRRTGEPVAYIIGQQGFWNLQLEVTTDTLIPRPETELLVEVALSLVDPAPARLVDLGTGTGAIALALASERPNWQVEGVDRIAAAVDLARRNANRNQLQRVNFSQGDWCTGLRPGIDLLVSNPPYIDPQDPHLQQGDVQFEPASALVAGKQGMAAINTIAHQAQQVLNGRGWLVFEHGYQQGEASRSLLRKLSYKQVASYRDLAGHERVTVGQISAKGEQVNAGSTIIAL